MLYTSPRQVFVEPLLVMLTIGSCFLAVTFSFIIILRPVHLLVLPASGVYSRHKSVCVDLQRLKNQLTPPSVRYRQEMISHLHTLQRSRAGSRHMISLQQSHRDLPQLHHRKISSQASSGAFREWHEQVLHLLALLVTLQPSLRVECVGFWEYAGVALCCVALG